MAKRGRKPKPKPVRPTPAPGTMAALLPDFLEASRVQHLSEATVQIRERLLWLFIDWCGERGVLRPGEVTRPILLRYQRHVFHIRKDNGQPLSWSSQHLRLVCVRAFFKWLTRNSFVMYNPASELELPRRVRALPRAVLTVKEAEQVLNAADVTKPRGVRDRAILETLYSTGVRRTELCNLDLFDLDTEAGLLLVRQGKGKKDRFIPVGDRALAWIEKYLAEVRPKLVSGRDGGALFLSRVGTRVRPNKLSDIVRRYVGASGISKKGACHLFRHTMATLMLENGADIRFIQQMLGHAEISTTQIYTQVSVKKLKEVHALTHPARLERQAKRAGEQEPTADDVLEALEIEVLEDEEAEDDETADD